MTDQVLENDWAPLLDEEFSKGYFVRLKEFLKKEYNSHTIYPRKENIYNALSFTPFHKVKVVILGQDPYHGPNQAHGLSFSVQNGIIKPPSLMNIFKELKDDLGYPTPYHGCLYDWANQGVLLLNTVLTVRDGEANSHGGKGWENFTDKIIEILNEKEHPIVYLLWGKAAQQKELLIDTDKHYLLKAAHPSPFSAYRGFFGSKPFSKTNSILRKEGLREIDWEL